MEGGELVVEQVFVFAAGLVGGDDGQALALQVPHGQRQAGGQFVQREGARRWRVAQRLQQAGLNLHEGLPALVLVFAAVHLATQGKPALGPGLQALWRGAVLFVVWGIAGVLGFLRVPGFQAVFDVAFEHFSQVVVAVELVFVGDASEGLNGFEYGHGSGSGGGDKGSLGVAHSGEHLYPGLGFGGEGVLHPLAVVVKHAVDLLVALLEAAALDGL